MFLFTFLALIHYELKLDSMINDNDSKLMIFTLSVSKVVFILSTIVLLFALLDALHDE